jgi:adenylosuccinate lyase
VAERFTDGRVPDPGVRALFAKHRGQCWQDVEAALAAGEHGGWVHWGATTQNIIQTGDVLVLREAHRKILRLLAGMLIAAADLAERTAGMLAAGRTHGQHAVPITFGFKPAGWIDELVGPGTMHGRAGDTRRTAQPFPG